MYTIMKKFYGGYEREKTLFELGNEISSTNPKMMVKIISKRKGEVWYGKGADVTFCLNHYYLKRFVQSIEENESGITINLR